MKIIKTGSNPQRGLSIMQEPFELINTPADLIVEAGESVALLPGLTEKSSLENSDIITTLSTPEVSDAPTISSPPTVSEIITASQRERLAVRKVTISKHGSFAIAPFGITQSAAALLGGFTANVGLALPTTKLAKFAAMEQTLRNNMELTSARQVVLAQVVNRSIRITHMYAAAAAFAVPYVFLRRVIENVRVAVNHLPAFGVGDISQMPFNDEEIQVAIGQVYNLSKGLPVMDPEFHDRIKQILEPTYTRKRAISAAVLEVLDVSIGIPSDAVYTSAGSPLTGCAIDDAFMHTTVDYIKPAGPVGFDQVVSPTVLADALFQVQNVDVAARTALLAHIQAMVTWLSNIKATYRDYLQYIAFAESKQWLVLKRTSDYLPELSTSAEGELSVDASAPFIFSHSKQMLRDYVPIAMFREGTANNTWARLHAPLTITVAGLARSNAVSASGVSRVIDLSNLSEKVHTIAELASWGIWAIEDTSVSDTAIDLSAVSCWNPYDGLQYRLNALRFDISAMNVITCQLSGNQFLFIATDANKLNTAMVYDTGLAGLIRELDGAPAGTDEPSTTVLKHYGMRRRMRLCGFNRTPLYVSNTVGEVEALVVDVENIEDYYYVDLPLLDFVKQCTPYYNQSLFDVASIKTK